MKSRAPFCCSTMSVIINCRVCVCVCVCVCVYYCAILNVVLSSSKSPDSGKMAATAPAIQSRWGKNAESGPCKNISQQPCLKTWYYISLATFICNGRVDTCFVAGPISKPDKITVLLTRKGEKCILHSQVAKSQNSRSISDCWDHGRRLHPD